MLVRHIISAGVIFKQGALMAAIKSVFGIRLPRWTCSKVTRVGRMAGVDVDVAHGRRQSDVECGVSKTAAQNTESADHFFYLI